MRSAEFTATFTHCETFERSVQEVVISYSLKHSVDVVAVSICYFHTIGGVEPGNHFFVISEGEKIKIVSEVFHFDTLRCAVLLEEYTLGAVTTRNGDKWGLRVRSDTAIISTYYL